MHTVSPVRSRAARMVWGRRPSEIARSARLERNRGAPVAVKFLTARPFLQSNHASNVQQDKSFQSREAAIERKGSFAEVENIALH